MKKVTFDLFNTLISTNPIEIYSRIAFKYGLYGTCRNSFLNAYSCRERRVAHFGKCHIEWWSFVVYDSLLPHNDKQSLDSVFPMLYDDILKEFMDAKSYKIYDDVVETLGLLKSMNIKLGIISNSDIRSLYILEILDLAKYFSTVILSQSEQMSKPDKRLFQKAFANSSGIHIGDSLEKDYYGAKMAGINGVLLVRNGCLNPRIDLSDQVSTLISVKDKV
jgi:REG-2-like HAD superfamily hydrolase